MGGVVGAMLVVARGRGGWVVDGGLVGVLADDGAGSIVAVWDGGFVSAV